MSNAPGLAACLLLAACTTVAPTPSPGPSASAAPTPTATTAPSPTSSATPLNGFPATVLGLRVHTVAEMSQLAADGRLDGRFAAVGGYWMRVFVMCPYLAHRAILDGFCTAGAFADDPDGLSDFGGDINSTGVPLTVPETANGEVLSSGTPVAVVLVIHGADSRAWQCEAADRPECHKRLVIDTVAWADGAPTADARNADGQVVTTYGLSAKDMNVVDPRLIGQASGALWYQRLLSGSPDADGTSAGVVRLLANPEGEGMVVAELPLAVDPAYQPARVVLDARPPQGLDQGEFRFGVSVGGDVIAQGSLSSSTPPLALKAGDYTVWGSVVTGAIVHDLLPCEMSLSLNAGADVAYYAQFERPSGCTWNEGE